MTNPDPFASDSAPSVSFKNAPVGTTKELEVLESAVMLQTRDYKTGEPAYWENKDGTKTPKMAAVVKVRDTEDDEVKSVWATKPSALFKAIGDAQIAAKTRLEPGDKLTIQFYDTKPSDDPKKEDQKLYRAKIEKAVFAQKAAPANDPWATPAGGDAAKSDEEPPF